MTGKMKGKNDSSKDDDRKIPCDCGKDIDYAKCINPKEIVHKKLVYVPLFSTEKGLVDAPDELKKDKRYD